MLDTERFIPVKSDENTVFTCFLEYELETVKIHDIVYLNGIDGWKLHTSCYRKLRLSARWVEAQLLSIGFEIKESERVDGFEVVIGVKAT